MDKKTVRRVVIIALAVLLVEQIFFLICGLDCLHSMGIRLWEN